MNERLTDEMAKRQIEDGMMTPMLFDTDEDDE